MILNNSLITLSTQYSVQVPNIYFIPILLINSQFYFNFMQNNIKYHSQDYLNTHLSLPNSQFSDIFSPTVLVSSDQENTTIKKNKVFKKKQIINSNVILINCSFTFCSYMSKDEYKGGSIFIENPISLSLKNCLFRKNKSRMSGSAIFVQNATLIDIDNCLFAENECKRHGCVTLHNINELIVKNTNFTLNTAKAGCGAISINQIEKKAILNNVRFLENEGKMSGTLYLENGTAEISDCLFYFNHIRAGPSSIKLGIYGILHANNTIFADEEPPTISLSIKSVLNVANCQFAHPQKKSIKVRGGNLICDNNTSFESAFEYKQVSLDPILNDELPNKVTLRKRRSRNNKETDNEDNKETDFKNSKKVAKEDQQENDNEIEKVENKEIKEDDNKEAEKVENKEIKKDDDEAEKENSKDSEKVDNKEVEKENNNEPVVVKHGANNQSLVVFPIQRNLNDKNSLFSISFIVGILLILGLIIYYLRMTKKNYIPSNDENISIFNREDLDPNTNAKFVPIKENLSDINLKDLPNVKMETF